MSDPFVHLHVHTEYSMLDGAAKVGPLFAEASRLGMPAVAMTDHGNMFGAAEFWEQASGYPDVKPILGIEAYVAPGSRFHRKPVFWGGAGSGDEGGDVSGRGAFTHMTLLAADATGLRNLFRLSSLASIEGQYKKPRMDRELLSRFASGLIATTGCPGGEVPTRLRLGQYREALRAASEYRDILGKENYLVELMDHGVRVERDVREGLLTISRDLGLAVVATNDSHYVTPDQAQAHSALLCVQTGSTLSDPRRFRFEGAGYHLKSAAEMREYWDREVPGAADTTLDVAERVGSYAEVFGFVDRSPLFPIPVSEFSGRAGQVLGARRVRVHEVAGACPLVLRIDGFDSLAAVGEALDGHEGMTPVVLVGGDGGTADTLVLPEGVRVSADLLRVLDQVTGVTVA